MSGEVLEKVGALMGEEAWKARVEDEVVLGSCLIAVVRANGRRSTNAMVEDTDVAVEDGWDVVIRGRHRMWKKLWMRSTSKGNVTSRVDRVHHSRSASGYLTVSALFTSFPSVGNTDKFLL